MRKLITGLFLLAIALFFLPDLASTGWAKSQLEAHLERQIGGRVKIEHLTLSWWEKQHCQKVTWTDPTKGIAMTADKVEVLAGLIDCLRYKDKPLNVLVEGAKMKSDANLLFLKKKKRKNLELEISPIRAKLAQKVISFEKAEIKMSDSLTFFTVGKIHLAKERMDITLGLPQKTLRKFFKEAQNLPEDFVLEIPLSTKLSSKAMERALLSFFLKNYGSIK